MIYDSFSLYRSDTRNHRYSNHSHRNRSEEMHWSVLCVFCLFALHSSSFSFSWTICAAMHLLHKVAGVNKLPTFNWMRSKANATICSILRIVCYCCSIDYISIEIETFCIFYYVHWWKWAIVRLPVGKWQHPHPLSFLFYVDVGMWIRRLISNRCLISIKTKSLNCFR